MCRGDVQLQWAYADSGGGWRQPSGVKCLATWQAEDQPSSKAALAKGWTTLTGPAVAPFLLVWVTRTGETRSPICPDSAVPECVDHVEGFSEESRRRPLHRIRGEDFDLGRAPFISAENSAASPYDEAQPSATPRFRAQRTREERDAEGKEQRVAGEPPPLPSDLKLRFADGEKCLAAVTQSASNAESAELCHVIHSSV